MSTPLNALEFNAQIAALVERYLQLEIAGKTAQNDENAERLCQFVCLDSLESAYLDDDKMRLLAYAVVGAEFQTLIKRGENVSVENQTEKYCRLFDDRCVELDRPELLKRLVQCELYNDPNSPLLRLSRDELQRRFPEIADFFDEYFERRRRAIFSCGVSRFADADADSKTPASVVSTSERYEVDLAPLGDADALGKLGAGGFKDVYAARQTSTNQTVALKILKKSGEEARELFKSEVLLQSKLTHPNVPQIFSFDESGVAPTLVERLIPGKSWGDLFDERSFDDNVATLATVSQIVAYAHERQHIIHADLKPENVMLGESGGRYNEVYLVDWGLARCLDDDDATRRSIGATPYYQPPETFEEVDLELSFATDVFLLGGILFRVLTGDAPYFRSYSAKSAFDAAEDAKKARIPEIPEVNPKTGRVNPPELVEIAKKALRYNPSERYPDAAAFLEALELYRRRASLGERLRAARD
ncbi:MAG: serine/threonine protein kinase, partial [Thermoguttaceae bacterium]|nr:serine/threonine protein kinase [Thermoguttaceae bacterium]